MQQLYAKLALLPVLAIGLLVILLSAVSTAAAQPRAHSFAPTFYHRDRSSVGQRTPLSNTTVEVTDFTFSPVSVTIHVGDTVIWHRGNGFHNVDADDNSFRLGAPDGSPSSTWITVSHTFTQAGTVPYHCDAHGGRNGVGMSGTI